MPELDFQIVGVEPVARGLTPLLHFKLRVGNTPATETIHGAMVHAQIRIQPAQRTYTAPEKEGLLELFGTPDLWGQTLRNRLWTHTNTTLPTFVGGTEAILPVQCTYDLNVNVTKYFHALEAGDVSLLFLFSGTIFYAGPDGRLQVRQISWDKECVFPMPARVWREAMEHHYPNSAWLSLHRDTFDRLCAYKRRQGLETWEQTIHRLLPELDVEEVLS